MTEYVLVSGGSGGIGGALCRCLAANGYHPVIGYSRRADVAENLADEIGGTALCLDMTSAESIREAIEFIAAGPHDLVGVVLAASPPPAIAPVFRLPEGEMEAQWEVNVLGPHALLDGAIRKLMRPKKKGWIVGVLTDAMGQSSAAAKSMGGYIIAKHGLLGLLKVVDAEYGWLDVMTIFPGYTETEMLGTFDSRFLDQMRAKSPEGRFASAGEVAEEIMNQIRGA
jgi:NAD(P)-dependent dehydrogenase (short-subunit alcohol dehydrogenase family)